MLRRNEERRKAGRQAEGESKVLYPYLFQSHPKPPVPDCLTLPPPLGAFGS